jgi:hypothetical protein
MPESMGAASQGHPQNEPPGRKASSTDRGPTLESHNLLISLVYFIFKSSQSKPNSNNKVLISRK